jgi:hypothetical protein
MVSAVQQIRAAPRETRAVRRTALLRIVVFRGVDMEAKQRQAAAWRPEVRLRQFRRYRRSGEDDLAPAVCWGS